MTAPEAAAGGYLYHQQPGARLYLGDATTVVRHLPAGSVDCVVTSPPYWRLRDYPAGRTETAPVGHGLEATPSAYVDRLRVLFAELARVLLPTGTVWLNLGDSYSQNSDGYLAARPGQPCQPRYRPRAGVPYKNLLGMPWRVAFALQADGWILRNAVVWHKPNPKPNPVADRFANRYELLFLLTRQPAYHFDLDPVRQPYTGDRALSRRAHRGGTKPNTVPTAWPPPGDPGGPVPGRNPGDVWTLPTRPGRHGGPPSFPLDLPLRAVAAGCPPGGTVLDPFSGAATTGQAALQLGRCYVGIDLDPVFHDLARARLERVTAASQLEAARPAPRPPPAHAPRFCVRGSGLGSPASAFPERRDCALSRTAVVPLHSVHAIEGFAGSRQCEQATRVFLGRFVETGWTGRRISGCRRYPRPGRKRARDLTARAHVIWRATNKDRDDYDLRRLPDLPCRRESRTRGRPQSDDFDPRDSGRDERAGTRPGEAEMLRVRTGAGTQVPRRPRLRSAVFRHRTGLDPAAVGRVCRRRGGPASRRGTRAWHPHWTRLPGRPAPGGRRSCDY